MGCSNPHPPSGGRGTLSVFSGRLSVAKGIWTDVVKLKNLPFDAPVKKPTSPSRVPLLWLAFAKVTPGNERTGKRVWGDKGEKRREGEKRKKKRRNRAGEGEAVMGAIPMLA